MENSIADARPRTGGHVNGRTDVVSTLRPLFRKERVIIQEILRVNAIHVVIHQSASVSAIDDTCLSP